MYFMGSRSARVERSWPSLMKVGPIFSRSCASCSASAAADAGRARLLVLFAGEVLEPAAPLTRSPRPYFMKSAAMSLYRFRCSPFKERAMHLSY